MSLVNIRELSNNETLYLDMQDVAHSCAIQFLLEIEESDDIEQVESAINASAITSGIHVRHHQGHWVASGALIKIKRKTVGDSNLTSDSIFNEKIDYNKESIQAYVINTPTKTFLLLKMLHAVCDGKGALLFTRNIFRYLNNEKLIVSNNTITDGTFLKKLGNSHRVSTDVFSTYKANMSLPVTTYSTGWRIIRLQGTYPGLIARLAKTIAKEFEGGSAKFMVPTDIRRHDRSLSYSGNLTLPIFLQVHRAHHWKEINGDLLFQLKNNAELNQNNVDYLCYKFLPRFIRTALIRYLAKRERFTVSAILSHLGRLDLAEFKSPVLKVRDFTSLPIQQPFTAFSVVAVEHSNQTSIALSYSAGQFTETRMDELAKSITDEFAHSIYDFNDTRVKYDQHFSTQIQMVLRDKAEEVAVINSSSVYSYKDLDIQIRSYAKELVRSNIGTGDKLIICMDRSFEYVALVVACIFEGIVFIPTDSKIPESRLRTIMLDSKAKAIATDKSGFAGRFKNSIYIPGIKSAPGYHPVKQHDPNRVLYIIYTSGSTGIPKGVEITEKNFSNYLSWAHKTYRTSEPLSMPLFTSLSVDLTLTSTILPLLCGGKIAIYEGDFGPEMLREILANESINTVKLTPTHLSLIATRTKKYTAVKKEIFIIGGETLRKDTVDALLDICITKPRIYNEYGPTETTVGSICHLYSAQKLSSSVVPIGVPIDNTQVLLYADADVVREENKVGEILIGGDGVCKGYTINVHDKKEVISDITYYRTGDLGYVRDGVLHCLGRIDSQVKINGNRIELEEIAHVLNQLDAIDDSCVIYKNGSLSAFVIANRFIEESAVLTALKKDLPHYMIPRHVILLKSFPILTSGKIDHDQLALHVRNPEQTCPGGSKVVEILSSFIEINTEDNGMTISSAGLDSLSTLLFLQKLAEQCIDRAREDSFINEALAHMGNMTILDLERLVMRYGGVI